MLARNKLKKIETLISQTLIDSEISHKEYDMITNEEEQEYRRPKETIRVIKKVKKLILSKMNWLKKKMKKLKSVKLLGKIMKMYKVFF